MREELTTVEGDHITILLFPVAHIVGQRALRVLKLFCTVQVKQCVQGKAFTGHRKTCARFWGPIDQEIFSSPTCDEDMENLKLRYRQNLQQTSRFLALPNVFLKT